MKVNKEFSYKALLVYSYYINVPTSRVIEVVVC